MGPTVMRVSTPVASERPQNSKSDTAPVNQTRSALIDSTMTENTRVVTGQKGFSGNPNQKAEHRMRGLTEGAQSNTGQITHPEGLRV